MTIFIKKKEEKKKRKLLHISIQRVSGRTFPKQFLSPKSHQCLCAVSKQYGTFRLPALAPCPWSCPRSRCRPCWAWICRSISRSTGCAGTASPPAQFRTPVGQLRRKAWVRSERWRNYKRKSDGLEKRRLPRSTAARWCLGTRGSWLCWRSSQRNPLPVCSRDLRRTQRDEKKLKDTICSRWPNLNQASLLDNNATPNDKQETRKLEIAAWLDHRGTQLANKQIQEWIPRKHHYAGNTSLCIDTRRRNLDTNTHSCGRPPRSWRCSSNSIAYQFPVSLFL